MKNSLSDRPHYNIAVGVIKGNTYGIALPFYLIYYPEAL